MLHNLSQNNSIIHEQLNFIRNKNLHNNRELFRSTIKKVGFLLGYEISRNLAFESTNIETPLGIANTKKLKEQPVLATILRAGLPLHEGLLQAFPESDNCFVGAYRKDTPDGGFTIKLDYLATTNLEQKILILADPMLATGASLQKTLNELFKKYQPKQTIIASVIASKHGIEHLNKHFPDIDIYSAAVDAELNSHGYIIPGLGDAGDLAFGMK
jgi:uracil phosphoribosyltransferase